MSKRRYFIELAYDGTAYNGWQVQPNGITVQQKLNEALGTILRQPVETLGCGRTDTGVHARQFFAHFEVEGISHQPSAISDARLVRSVNGLLPYDIGVKRIFAVHDDAHARFDATQRSYAYHVHFEKDPFLRKYSWQLSHKPDLLLMNEAAAVLKTYTDFSCFSKSNTQTFTNNCRIDHAEWTEESGGLVFRISADRFLRNMVRAIVGTLVDIGTGKIPVKTVHEIIASKNRSEAGASVPACGLFLTEVKYPYITG
ncbi:MAG: tRNA pseudouridine(38-40) synthase TruA [Mucilaginibacter polytrichastri]|nr:tRNA pseudouridine(38-40) synthase TruA [Mucilaginibacter polytrichastri]